MNYILADANRLKAVLEIDVEKEILKKEGDKNMSVIENEITKLQQETIANADKYSKEKAAEANKLLFTSEYVSLETAKALSTNTKFYFSGETSPLGSLLSKLIN